MSGLLHPRDLGKILGGDEEVVLGHVSTGSLISPRGVNGNKKMISNDENAVDNIRSGEDVGRNMTRNHVWEELLPVRRTREDLLDTPATGESSSTWSDRFERGNSSSDQPAHALVFTNPGISIRVASFQDGQKGSNFWNGDVAASVGLFNLMQAKHMEGDPLSYTPLAMSRAAKEGRMNMVTWLHNNTGVEQCETAMDSAAAGGHLDIVKFLNRYRPDGGCTKFAMNGAAEAGALDVVKWLHEYRTEGCTEKAMDGAALEGHLEVVKWLHHNRKEGCTTDAMDNAAENGSLNVIKWLHHNRKEGCTGNALFLAAKHGHDEVFRWLFENRPERCLANKSIFDWVAQNGHLSVIKVLHELGVEGCSTRAMNWAAAGGHMETVQWLHENRTEGCTREAMDGAAASGHLDVIKWLHLNRKEGCSIRAMNHAALGGHLDVVMWLHQNRNEGCTDTAMDNAAKNGHLEVVKFLHYQRREGCSTNALDWASARGHQEIVLFLLTNRREGYTHQALDWSTHSGHFGITDRLAQSTRLRASTTRTVGGGVSGSYGDSRCCSIS